MALIEELDDRTLVEQHRSGDDDAFRHIVLRHHRSLYANALRRLGDPVLAEDAVQETFLRAFRNLHRFEGEYHLDAWLHRIVTNACHDIGRRRGRDTRLFDRACTAVEVEAPPADDGLEVVPDREFNAALDRLPETYREVLLLRFVEELSYPDVAEKAGITEENARARVSRGRNMLKKMMTSASGLVIWAIPPLRRAQMQVQDPDAVASVGHAAHSASAITTFVAQAGPAIATAGPAVTTTAPTLKAAVAAGLAAAVAIPTGVAVDRAMQKPAPQTAAPLVEDESAAADPSDPVEASAPSSSVAPSTSEPAKVSALSAGPSTEATVEDITGTTVGGSTTTTPTSEPVPTTSTPPSTDSGTGPPPPAEEEPTPPPAEEQPAPAPAPSGELQADALVVEDAGPRAVHLSGPISLTVGDRVLTGEISGKLDLGDPDPKDASAPRSVDTTLNVVIDGTPLELILKGTAVVTGDGSDQTLALDVRFGFRGAGQYGLAESGQLTGTLTTRDGAGTLALTLPGKAE